MEPSLSRGGVSAHALDHGAHAVRALRREMLLQTERAKGAQGVDGENRFGARSEKSAIEIAINPRTTCESLSPR